MPISRRGLIGAAGCFGLAPALAQAPQWPSRNITIAATLAAGSGLDIVARLYAEKLAATLGKPVVVENRPGARQMIAANVATKADPDGHALAVLTATSMATGATLFKDFRFDPTRDFAPVSIYLKAPFVLVVHPGSGPADFAAFAARAKPGAGVTLSYSSLGPGTPQHLAMEVLKQNLGLDLSHVPYTNTSQSILDIVSGHVACGFAEAATAIPLVREGKLRALAVSSQARFESLPEIAPIAEAAKLPGLELVSWHGLIAHAATPRPVLERLNAEMNRIMADAEIRRRLVAMGLLPMEPMTLDQTRDYVLAEQKKWGDVVRKLGLEGSQ